MNARNVIIFFILVFHKIAFCEAPFIEDFRVLQKKTSSFPLQYSHSLDVGYYSMPSARVPVEGEFSAGMAMIFPYKLMSLHYQPFDRLDVAFHYWIFHQLIEPNFGQSGYGEDADRAASIKWALIKASDGFSFMPEVSVGINDFMGSKRFFSLYGVMTKSFCDGRVEGSLGWGKGRIRGPFGALAVAPFVDGPSWAKGLSFGVEYDANHYKGNEEHPKAKKVSSLFNMGLQYTFLNTFNFTLSSLRGRKAAFSSGIHYDIGNSPGLFPKNKDPKIYNKPVINEAIGPLRKQKEFIDGWLNAFQQQGFQVYSLDNIFKNNEQCLSVSLVNGMYWKDSEVRKRIEHLISALTPENYSEVVVQVAADGLVSHQYSYRLDQIKKVKDKKSSISELHILSPRNEISAFASENKTSLFFERKKSWSWTLRPRLLSYFGSAKGKVKCDLGLLLETEGYLPYDIYYNFQGSYIAFSSSKDVGDKDCLNPSQLINVRSDFVKYYQTSSAHLDVAYLQRNWNFGNGFFGRVSGGYYEIAYAGVTGEALYYPVNNSNWSLGFEVSSLLKRKYWGVGFQNKIRQLKGNLPTEVPFLGLQYFLSLNYVLKTPFEMNFSCLLGRFLAKDKGVRFEATRAFPSGLELSLWYSLTDGKDAVNGSRYYDKGFGFSLPFDFFLNKSSREKVGYSMSAWLRDVGAKAYTGKQLFNLLNDQR